MKTKIRYVTRIRYVDKLRPVVRSEQKLQAKIRGRAHKGIANPVASPLRPNFIKSGDALARPSVGFKNANSERALSRYGPVAAQGFGRGAKRIAEYIRDRKVRKPELNKLKSKGLEVY